MGTEILWPQDCLIERIRVPPASFSRRKAYYGNPNPNPSYYYSNPRSTRKSVVRSEKRDEKRRFVSTNQSETSVSKRSSSDDLRAMQMDKVVILRRGESLDSKIKSEELKKKEGGDGLVVSGTERLGPDPEMVLKQTRIQKWSPPLVDKPDVYAGSAFAMSPAPSSLPLPSFSKKKQALAIVDDSATRDLRRLLRLD